MSDYESRTIWRWQAESYEREGWRISRCRMEPASLRPRWLWLHPFTWFDEVAGRLTAQAFRR